MTTTTLNRCRAEKQWALRAVPGFLDRIGAVVADFMDRSRAEQQLANLDDRLLADIGVARNDIAAVVWGKTHRRG
jgi:uncharacterized protein YjiS (DUF1127 family)